MAILEPGVPTAMFGRLDAEFKLRGRIALTPVADAIKKQARINASSGKHKWGTKTPATPGTGPAIISKTLVNSIDRTTVDRYSFGWLVQIGTAAQKYPSYPGVHRPGKPSSQYGYILEVTGCRNGYRYPFLYAAAKFGFDTAAPIIYGQIYGEHWARLI